MPLRFALALVTAAIVLCPAPWAAARAADIPPVSDAELEQALALAGTNRVQLEQALLDCEWRPFGKLAMRFLIASLPLVDLGTITRDELVENLDLAIEARTEFDYAMAPENPASLGTLGRGELLEHPDLAMQQVPDNGFKIAYDNALWAHYVLPPRVSQEPLSPWRAYFHEQLRDVVKDCKTLDEAALKVNYWCGERVRFQQTQSRDQHALATLKSGYGRCEEEVIFFISACRAVGIPARQAYCPFWAVSDNNHAWAEVYAGDGRWHYVGACEPAPALDSAWFGGAVKQAPLIVSVCFGLPGATEPRGGTFLVNENGEEILSLKEDLGARYCLLNSTANYRQTGRLVIEEPAGAPSTPGTRGLYLHVYNWGALRDIARLPFKSGVVSVALGAGDYQLSCDAPDGPRTVLVRVQPNVDSRIAWDAQVEEPADAVLQFPADPLTP